MRTEHVAGERALVCVLNEAVLEGHPAFEVRSSMLDIPLVRLDLGRRHVDVLAGKPDFDRALDLRLGSDRLRADLPDHGDLRGCLLTAGLLDFSNGADVRRTVGELAALSADWQKHPKRLYVGMDTNMMYLRFPSRRLPRVATMCHVCSQGVEQEVAAAVNDKYGKDDVRQLKGALGRRSPVDGLWNAPMKRSRQAKGAHSEVRHVRGALGGLKAECEGMTKDAEENDTLIVASYARFAREQNAEVALFSADRDFVEKAEASELRCANVLYPGEVPGRLAADEAGMMHLVHDLAGVFGAVDLAGLGVRVWGAWAGKTAGEWAGDVLRFDVEEGSRVAEELGRDLRILMEFSGAKG